MNDYNDDEKRKLWREGDAMIAAGKAGGRRDEPKCPLTQTHNHPDNCNKKETGVDRWWREMHASMFACMRFSKGHQ